MAATGMPYVVTATTYVSTCRAEATICVALLFPRGSLNTWADGYRGGGGMAVGGRVEVRARLGTANPNRNKRQLT